MTKIESLFQEWRSLQPLKKEDQIRLDQKFMLEFNYNSNHLEGNTLTYGQTEFLLMFGKAVDNADMKDLEDMKASNVALQKIKTEAEDRERPLTEAFIRDLHRTLLREDYEESRQGEDGIIRTYTVHAGIYKTRPNSVKTATGAFFAYASPEETPALMTDLVQWYNEEEKKNQLSPIELATLFHYRYIRIHPFEDGNGRISRLLVNFILHRCGYPMIVVKSEDKENYLLALNRCDVVVGSVPAVGARAALDQIQPFADYLSNCLERALVISIKAAKGKSIEDEDDFMKKLTILERNARKVLPRDAHVVTRQDKMDVFNNFHRQFAEKLIRLLNPSTKFYNSCSIHYFMSKDKDTISRNSFFGLDPSKDLTNDRPQHDLEVIDEARSILFHYTLTGTKSKYKMKDTPIFIKASVFFEDICYVFNDKTYIYGSYPTKEDLDTCVDSIKEKVLNTISESLE